MRLLADSREDELPKAFLGSLNINTAEFFEPIRQKLPHLSIGCRFAPLDGEAHHFGKLETLFEQVAFAYLEQKRGSLSSSEIYDLKMALLEEYLALSDYMASFTIAEKGLRVVAEKQGRLMNWLNIIDTDLNLREITVKRS